MRSPFPLPMAPETPSMPATSRYHSVGVVEREDGSGRTIRVLRRRFIQEVAPEVSRVTVPPGVRADQLADALVGAPDQWWRLADANSVRTADELEQAGRSLRLPSGDS